MSLYCFDIVEVWLPVFDNAIIASREEPILVVRVRCRPYRDIMRL